MMAIFIVCYLNSFVKHSIVSIIIWCSMHIPPANILPIFFFYSFYNFGLVSETHDRQHILIYKLKTQNTHLESITLWRFRPFIIHSTHSRIQLVVVSHRTQTEKNIQNPGSRLGGGECPRKPWFNCLWWHDSKLAFPALTSSCWEGHFHSFFPPFPSCWREHIDNMDSCPVWA